MTNQERISELIDEYTRLIAHEHHKMRDGYFGIEVSWSAYDSDEVIPKFTAVHDGYLHRYDRKDRYTYEAAERDLLQFLEEIVAEVKEWEPEEEWGRVLDRNLLS